MTKNEDEKRGGIEDLDFCPKCWGPMDEHLGSERVREAARSFVNNCRCDKAYKGRNLTDPGCAACEFAGYLKPEDLATLLAPEDAK